MRPAFFVALLCLVPLGCRSPEQDTTARAARTCFEPTTESQDVVFLTKQAPFVGGPVAGAVYLKPGENARLSVGGSPVLISNQAHQDLLARLPKPAPEGADFLVIPAEPELPWRRL